MPAITNTIPIMVSQASKGRKSTSNIPIPKPIKIPDINFLNLCLRIFALSPPLEIYINWLQKPSLIYNIIF